MYYLLVPIVFFIIYIAICIDNSRNREINEAKARRKAERERNLLYNYAPGYTPAIRKLDEDLKKIKEASKDL